MFSQSYPASGLAGASKLLREKAWERVLGTSPPPLQSEDADYAFLRLTLHQTLPDKGITFYPRVFVFEVNHIMVESKSSVTLHMVRLGRCCCQCISRLIKGRTPVNTNLYEAHGMSRFRALVYQHYHWDEQLSCRLP
jgi:hypothetical protein